MSLFLILMECPPCSIGVGCGKNGNKAKLSKELFKYNHGHYYEGEVQSTMSVYTKKSDLTL